MKHYKHKLIEDIHEEIQKIESKKNKLSLDLLL